MRSKVNIGLKIDKIVKYLILLIYLFLNQQQTPGFKFAGDCMVPNDGG